MNDKRRQIEAAYNPVGEAIEFFNGDADEPNELDAARLRFLEAAVRPVVETVQEILFHEVESGSVSEEIVGKLEERLSDALADLESAIDRVESGEV